MPESQPLPDGQFDNADLVRWSLPTRIAFRFCFCYFLPLGVSCFYINADILHHFAGFWDISPFNPWVIALPWICRHLFNVQRKIFIYPEGDYLSSYLQHLFELILTFVITLTWSILDRKRPNYRRLYAWFTLFLRCMLAITLFGYGFDKVFPLQFGDVTPERLTRPLGSLDMFNLLWTFMAASKPYTIFSGSLEVLAGVLLLLPRLEMLGAFLSVAVLSNVFLLNMDYGVPVKLYSSHLLMISVFLALPAMLQVANLLVLRRTTSPLTRSSLSRKRWIDRTATIAILTLTVLVGISTFFACWIRYKKLQADAVAAESTPFHGMWTVDSFSTKGLPTANGSQPAPMQSLFTPKLEKEYHAGAGQDHWLGLIFDTPKRMTILLNDGVTDGVDLASNSDALTGPIQLTDSDDPAWKASLKFQSSGKDILSIEGVVNGVSVSAQFHRKDLASFPLTTEKLQFFRDEGGN